MFGHCQNFEEKSEDFNLRKLISTYYTITVLSSATATTLESYFNKEEDVVLSVTKEEVDDLVESHIMGIKTGTPIPPPLSWYNTYTTNLDEGEAFIAINNSSRFLDIINAIYSFSISVNQSLNKFKTSITLIHMKYPKISFTPISYKLAVGFTSTTKLEVVDTQRDKKIGGIHGVIKSENGDIHLCQGQI